MQLADSQERHAQLDDKVISSERSLNDAREQQRGLERQAQEATFTLRSLQARQGELQRSLDTAATQEQSLADEATQHGYFRFSPVALDTATGFMLTFNLRVDGSTTSSTNRGGFSLVLEIGRAHV